MIGPRGADACDAELVLLGGAGERSVRVAGFAKRAGVGWFLCDAGGGGHAAATTSGVATVAGPEFLSALVLVVARPQTFVFLLPLQRHRHRSAS